MKLPSNEDLKVRFHELRAELDLEWKRLAPFQEDQSALQKEVAVLLAKQREIGLNLQKESAKVVEIQKEMSSIAKVLRNPDGTVDTALPKHKGN